jgi:predicted nucleic acid-binding protein
VITYFETSAFVKLVVVEEGSNQAGRLWDASDMVVTSLLTYVEARAALAGARRQGRLSSSGLGAAKEAFQDRFEETDVVQLSLRVARSAGDLAEEHHLRGYDAVHLASALTLGTDGILLATWDRDLAAAANSIGLDVGGLTP